MKEYLEQRIAHLKKVEMEYFDKSVDKQIGYNERLTYRRFSNEFNAARRECELLLNLVNGIESETGEKIISVTGHATPQAASNYDQASSECPYRVQNSCTFRGIHCNNESCDIRGTYVK